MDRRCNDEVGPHQVFQKNGPRLGKGATGMEKALYHRLTPSEVLGVMDAESGFCTFLYFW